MIALSRFMPEKKPLTSRFCQLLTVPIFAPMLALLPFASLAQNSPAQASLTQTSLTQTSLRRAPLTLQQAIALSLRQHPDLQTFVHRRSTMAGYVEQAKIAAAPRIGFTIEDFMGSGDDAGLKSAQSTLSIAWVVDKARIKRRVEVAKQQGETVAVHQAIKALDIAAETARLFIHILVDQQRLALAKRALRQAKTVHDVITTAAGKSTRVDLLLAKNAIIQRELDVEELNHQLDTRHYQLFAQWDAQPGTVSGSLQSLPKIATNGSFEQLASQIAANPQLKLFANQTRVAQAQIAAARSNAKPLWRFNAGVRRNEASDDFSLVAGVSIPFTDEHRNRGTISALNSQIQHYDAQADALEKSLRNRLYPHYQEIEHSRHTIAALTGHSIPTLEQALQLAQQAYRLGRYSYIEWNAIENEWLVTQQALLAAYSNLHLNHIEIERLTGGTL